MFGDFMNGWRMDGFDEEDKLEIIKNIQKFSVLTNQYIFMMPSLSSSARTEMVLAKMLMTGDEDFSWDEIEETISSEWIEELIQMTCEWEFCEESMEEIIGKVVNRFYSHNLYLLVKRGDCELYWDKKIGDFIVKGKERKSDLG